MDKKNLLISKRNLSTPIIITLVTLFLITFLSSYCIAETPQNDTTIDESYPGVRMVVASKGLYKKIKLVNPKLAPYKKFMRGQVGVQNFTNKNLSLEYKFDWFDTDGFLIGDGGLWTRFGLAGQEMSSFKSLGKNRHAASMQFTVRYVNDVNIDRDSRN